MSQTVRTQQRCFSENVAQGYAIACQLCTRLLIALTTGTATADETKDSASKELARSFIYRINNNVRGVRVGLLIFCFGACPWHNNRRNWARITAGQEGRQWQMKVKRGRDERKRAHDEEHLATRVYFWIPWGRRHTVTRIAGIHVTSG